ncbi:hypothetical protein DMN91_011878 [Ooceraea biroi]|uniref:Histone-lysine N-methyltransferase SUV39H2 n=1 Tax=Ooceraea biroi TaxID=2015173 RepID=A0A3L8D759_OOCBI|nr:hypothetical protein DMN91_011878 [Ooceraea biroi]
MGGEERLGVTTGQPNLYKQDLSKLVSSNDDYPGVAIAHAADGYSGELADIAGDVDSRTPIVCKKRHLSAARGIDIASCAMRPRLLNTENHDNDNMSQRLDIKALYFSSSSSSSLSSSSTRLRVRRRVITQQALETLGGDSGSRMRKEINTRDTGSDGRQSDYESSSDGRLSVREYGLTKPGNALELKEARVLLHDVMRNGEYRRETVSTDEQHTRKRMKLWEVERIIQKHVQNNKPLYLIKWKNWDSRYNTWEPLCNLINCEDMLREFEEERQKLIDLFKAKTNFYPEICDVERFLAELRYKGMSIDDASVIVGTKVDNIYSEIRHYLKSSHKTREVKIKRQIVCMLLAKLRCDQLESLQEWENEMNSITKGRPTIRVENLMDLEGAPQDFYYIDNYLPGTGVTIPDDPPIGCECVNVCETGKSGCCYAQNGATLLPYTSTYRMRVPPGVPIYECNKRCICDILTCPNRVVQRGSDMQLCIFRTDNGRGWGVRTLRAIKKGTFVAQYVGEIISSEEAERRDRQYDMTGRTYLFDLDYNETDGQCPYTVDAAMYGNVTHFINHSCDPNLAVYAVWINCLDPNLPNLALFAIKDIKQNEELTFDYTSQMQRGNDKMQQQPFDKINADVDVDVSKNKTLCKCGAATCRRYLF